MMSSDIVVGAPHTLRLNWGVLVCCDIAGRGKFDIPGVCTVAYMIRPVSDLNPKFCRVDPDALHMCLWSLESVYPGGWLVSFWSHSTGLMCGIGGQSSGIYASPSRCVLHPCRPFLSS